MEIAQYEVMLSASLPCSKRNVPTAEEVIQDLKKLNWERGFLASPKYDGIRAIKHPERGLLSRTMTRIPNLFVQEALSHSLFDNIDGELVYGNHEETENFNLSQSAIMSQHGSPFFTWCVFDDNTFVDRMFRWRNDSLRARMEIINNYTNFQKLFALHYVEQRLCKDIDELLRYEEDQIARGFEGIIFRDPGCRYKNGRSTFKQQGMIKLKRFIDAEAAITGFEELLRNRNEQTVDARGYADRSDHKAGFVPAGTLGVLRVKGINGRFAGVDFGIGSGLDDAIRAEIWANQEAFLGKIVKYKYQGASAIDKPRLPIFLGLRDHRDTDVGSYVQ